MLSVLMAFLAGTCFLGRGLSGVYDRAANSLGGSNGASSERAVGRFPSQNSAIVDGIGQSPDAWKYTALYSVFGVSLVVGSAYTTFRWMRKKPPVSAASPPSIEIPFSIQVALFEKRQHLFHALLKDQTGLWQDGLQVRHLMTREVVSVLPSAPVPEIVELIREKGIRHVLVCDDDKKLLGVLSDRNLCANQGTTARDLMSSRLLSTTPETPINQAITCLIQERISCLPVLENDRLCGLITTTDMLLALQCTLQIWGFFAGLLRDDFYSDLELFQQEMDEQSRQIDASLSILRSMEHENTSQEMRPLFEELHRVFEKLHGFSGKIEHLRSHCLENVKMVQKLTDF
jgi:CBS domain-containing protein